MSKTQFNPLLKFGLQKFFDPKNDIKEAVNTDAVIMKDTSGNKKWAIKHNNNIVKYDHYSPEPDNKIVNSGFETDLSSWISTLSYVLNDQFTTDRAAGSVNGTQAEPTGGVRTVVDTENKLSVAAGQVSFAGGKTSPTYGDPGIWYPATTRSAGKTFILNANLSTSNVGYFGFDTNQSGQILGSGLIPNGVNGLRYILPGGSGSSLIADLIPNTAYQYAVTLRSSGAYYFVRGGIYTNWTLLYSDTNDSTATLYPGWGSYSGTASADNMRIPTSLWLPSEGVVYDTFDRADGAIGNSLTSGPDSQTISTLAWTGGAISGNKNVITPTLGSELVTNGDMSSSTGWTLGTGWSIGGGIASHTGANYSILEQAITTVGRWYQTTYTITARASGDVNARFGTTNGAIVNGLTTYTNSARQTSGTNNGLQSQVFEGSVDNFSTKELTLSSLFSTVSTSDADVIADAGVTLTSGTQAGLVLNLDSTSSPQNFILVYHDGTNVKLEKSVAGTYTTVQSTASTYVAGATLRVIKDGTKYRVYYNNALMGSEQTISDAGIISNTIHGMFSTYEGNSFDNFTLWPRNTHFEDAPFEELTVSRDTTTKYAGTASAKLVAGGVNATFLQSINVGDTVSYTLIAYAYTTGAAVTSADVELYYDTAVLSTSYTDMGSGWYRLTGTLTGVASSKDYGVKVKAGKTVYIDTVSLQAGTGATIEVTFENSSSGIMNATFENDVTVGGDITVGTETLTEANVTALKALI